MLSGRFKVWAEALPKFGKEKEARLLSGAFTNVLSHVTRMSAQVTLGCGWIMLFLEVSVKRDSWRASNRASDRFNVL